MSTRRAQATEAIGWERVRAIFGDPRPPVHVSERQFDYADHDLQRIARTPHDQIEAHDLWFYYHDLAYVELQPDLFAYLFPVCLMDWHSTLMRNEDCAHGDSEFHYALLRGAILDKHVTASQREAIFKFFRDSFVARLDTAESSCTESTPGIKRFPGGWLFRFNSLGLVVPRIDLVWDAWWSLATAGRAVAVSKYCSALMYWDDENPFFPKNSPHSAPQYSVPPLWANDSFIHDRGWLDDNVRFLRKTLTVDYLHEKLIEAAKRLTNEPQAAQVHRMLNDWPRCADLASARVQELPLILQRGNATEWTV
jgi:hypothetical protein